MQHDPTTREGGCLCRGIRYALEGQPRWVMQCCCRDCQLATGTGHTTILGIHHAQVTLRGSPAIYSTSGDTGGRVHRHFCPTCGSRLFTTGDLPGPLWIFQCGTLDDPASVRPTAAIYTKDRIVWDHLDPALPVFDQMYPFTRADLG